MPEAPGSARLAGKLVTVAPALAPTVVKLALRAPWPVALTAAGAVAAAYLVDRARKQGASTLEVGPAEAAELQFPPGHPRPGVVYVGHPLVPHQYFTLAEFHRRTFEHKVCEVIDILAHLGAQHYRVEHVRGRDTAFLASMGATVAGGDDAAGNLRVAGAKHSGSSVRSEWRLAPRLEAASLPDRLFWYPHEDLWQRVAMQRIRHGLQSFALEVSYEDDFGVNADVALRFNKAGLNLGGSFLKHEATTWRLVGEFYPMASKRASQ